MSSLRTNRPSLHYFLFICMEKSDIYVRLQTLVKKIILGWLLVALVYVAGAQERLYNFERFTDDRLPGNAVRRVVTDEEGFLWLATNKGLYLFDRFNSKNFTHDYRNPTSISSNNLSGICEDGRGGMWITSYTGGLSHYDKSLPASKAFTNYTYYRDGSDTVSMRMLNDVVTDADGNTWFGGQDTDVLKMDGVTKQISRVALVPDSVGPLSIYDLFLASDGKIWVGTRHHGIFCVDPQSGASKAYNLKPQAKPWVEENGCGSFAEHDGFLWFSYYDYNLCSLNLKTGELATDLLGIGPNGRVYDNAIHSVATRGSMVLAAHQSKGIYQYDRVTGSCSLLDWKILTPEDPAGDVIATINVDAAGPDSTIMMATDKGFIVGRAADVTAKRSLTKAVVNSFFVHDRDFSHLLRQGAITLDHEQNFFTFAFSAPGAIDPDELQFAFMLEGVDKAWRLAKTDFSVAYTDIARGDYRFLVRSGDDMGNWNAALYELPITIKGPYWQTPWFYGVLSLLFFLIVYGVFRYRLNQSRKLNALQLAFNDDLKQQLAVKTAELKSQMERIEAERKEKLESDYQKRLSESELKAIRAQMNPHFMFNVLNSIESYILESDARAASRLVQKFAKLNRLVLENSAYSYVSVAREWEALNLYVELEALRFNNEFDYDFSTIGDVDMKNLFIPPMLVQPLIENAIHHGIRQQVGRRGRLQITVQQEEGSICFTIVDNGAGLERSRAKPSHPYKKTSMGLATIEERLRLINRNAGGTTGKLELTSLTADGTGGTKAVLCIPLVMTPFSILD